MGTKATHHIPDEPGGQLLSLTPPPDPIAAPADPVASQARSAGDQGLSDGPAQTIPADSVGAVAAGSRTRRSPGRLSSENVPQPGSRRKSR